MFIRSEELMFQIWGFTSDTMLWGNISPPPAAPLSSDWTSQKAVDWKNHKNLGTYGSRGSVWSGMTWPIGEESIWCRTCHGPPCRSQCWSHSDTLQGIKQRVRSLPLPQAQFGDTGSTSRETAPSVLNLRVTWALTCCSLSSQRSTLPSRVLSHHLDIVCGSRLKIVQGVGGDVTHKQIHWLACRTWSIRRT